MLSAIVAADLAAFAERLESDCRVMRPRMMSLDVPREVQADEFIAYSQWISRTVRTMVSGGCLSESACREALDMAENAFKRGVGIEL